MRLLRPAAAMLAVVVATWLVTTVSADQPILGSLIHAQGPVHSMNRTALEAELTARKAPFDAAASDDALKLLLYQVRSHLLQQRASIVSRAEQVMHEVHSLGGNEFLAELSLDSVIADDNAIFATAVSNRMLSELKTQSLIGAAVALIMQRFHPLGRLPALKPLVRSPIGNCIAVSLGGGALLGVLQVALGYFRRLVAAPSDFCQKLTAVTCREGVMQWMVEAEAATSEGAHEPQLLPRRDVALPILLLATGSSVFEEAVFRGVLLHGLVTRLRAPPMLAATLTSIIFGLAHVGNEASRLHRAIYAGWTFFGGMVFSAAYLATNGGLLAPTALHFFLNAIIFSDSTRKVSRRWLTERDAVRAIASRVAASSAMSGRSSAQGLPAARQPVLRGGHAGADATPSPARSAFDGMDQRLRETGWVLLNNFK